MSRTLLAFRHSKALIRFGVASMLNTVFGYVTFALLLLSGVWPGAALAGTIIIAIGFNFQTSRRLMFRSNGHIARFVAVYIVVLIINFVALGVLRRHGLPDLVSQAFLTLPIAALSFAGQRHFVFNRTERA